MEIFSKLGIDWRLFLAQLINFLIFFYVFKRFVFTPVLKVLEERRRKIQSGLKYAEQSEELHEKAKKKAEKIVLNAKREAKDILQSAHKDAKYLSDGIVEKAKKDAQAILQGVEKQAKDERNAYVQRFKGDIAKLVVLAAEKVVGKHWDTLRDKAYIEQVLLEVSQEKTQEKELARH